MDDCVIWRVEWFTLELLGKHCDRAVVFVADDLSRAVLTRNLPSLEIEGVSVTVAAWIAKLFANVAIFFQPAMLNIVRDIAPQKITAYAIPSWPFGPEHLR